MQHEVPLPTWQNGTPSFFQCTHASVENRRIAYTKEVGAKKNWILSQVAVAAAWQPHSAKQLCTVRKASFCNCAQQVIYILPTLNPDETYMLDML
jgi:hypothetical protein